MKLTDITEYSKLHEKQISFMSITCTRCGKIAERSGKCATCSRAERKEAERAKRVKMVVKEIRKVSPKMAFALSEYNKKRKVFLADFWTCKCCQSKTATEIHHKKGRATIELLLDEQYWLPVCRTCHHRIELNPPWAKEKGYSLERLTKTI